MTGGDLIDVAVKIGLAALLSGIIGAEREWTGKWAGLRTHMLIAVGSAFLTHVSIYVGPLFAEGSNAWDPGRIAAQIVSGIGFIGAGTIIQSRGAVHGLTTAAGLWVASAIGIAVGAGLYAESTLVSIVLFLIMVALRPVERYLLRGKRRTLVLPLASGQRPSNLMEFLEREEIQVEDLSLSEEGGAVRLRFLGTNEEAVRLTRRLVREGLIVSEEREALTRPPFP
ncbi:MAG TPA: MgtC/SapB family protein [Thermoanaerobaculia bacterium]|nr:MgtC/SapB family protein [Thermoanaerobaculia bacterium]